jgi:hypothetical protein
MIQGGDGPFPAEAVRRPEEQHVKTSHGCRLKHELKLFPVGGLRALPVNKLVNHGP